MPLKKSRKKHDRVMLLTGEELRRWMDGSNAKPKSRPSKTTGCRPATEIYINNQLERVGRVAEKVVKEQIGAM